MVTARRGEEEAGLGGGGWAVGRAALEALPRRPPGLRAGHGVQDSPSPWHCVHRQELSKCLLSLLRKDERISIWHQGSRS